MTAPTTRTDGIDFAAIIKQAITSSASGPLRTVADRGVASGYALAGEVPELCPDCKGSGSVLVRVGCRCNPKPPPGDLRHSVACNAQNRHRQPCAHPNAPTIGQMLREWQALTALAEYAQHDGMCGTSQAYGPITCDCGLDAARAALEAVRGD